MKKNTSFIKRIISLMLIALIIFTSTFVSFSTPLSVYASAPIAPVVSETDVIFGIMESLGYVISIATGIDTNIDDGNPFTEHDFAKFAYDYLVSIGLNDVALDTIWSVAYLDPDWDQPKTYDQLSQKTLGEIARDQIENYEKMGEIPDFYVKYKAASKDIFDTLPSFVDSVLDGTNTLKLGDKTITAEAITGFDDYKQDADGKYITSVIAAHPVIDRFNYTYADTRDVSKEVLLRRSVNGYYTFGFYRLSGNRLVSQNKTINYCQSTGATPDMAQIVFQLSTYDSMPVSSTIPIFDVETDAIAFLTDGTRTGMVNDAQLGSTGKFDYATIANTVMGKILPFLTGSAVSVKGLYDAYVGTRDNIKSGGITDTPAYIDAVFDVMQGIKTIDKAISGDEPIPLPDSGAEILEWIKTIASAVVVIPTELRRISLSALENSVGAIADIFPAIRQDLKAISDTFPALRNDVKTIGDVFPALRQDLKAVADDFPAVKRTLDALGETFPAIRQGIESIVDTFPSFVDYQLKILPKVTGISDVLNAISARFKELSDAFADSALDTKGKLGSILDVLDIPLSGLLDIPLSNIADKVDSVTDALTDLKDFKIELPDYMGILGKILAVLEAIRALVQFLVDWFTIDPVLLKDALTDALADVKYNTGLEPLLAFYKKFQFTDKYTYPRITMGVADYMKAYYPYDEIVLIDFGDYATAFIYVRTILKVCIWFSFGILQFERFKVSHHIA